MHDIPLDLPGSELVVKGLADLRAGDESEASLIVAMAAPRLRALGVRSRRWPRAARRIASTPS